MATRFYMVEIVVADWRAALAWYRDVFGMTVELTDAPGAFALLRSGDCRLAVKGGTPNPGSTTLAFEVDDLSAALDRVAAAGGQIDGEPSHSPEGYRRVTARDPNGYRLVLFAWEGSNPSPR